MKNRFQIHQTTWRWMKSGGGAESLHSRHFCAI